MKAYKFLIKEQQGCRCGVCLREFRHKELQIHHILFRSQGGKENRSNLIALCKNCHKLLHNHPEKFLDQVLYYQSRLLPYYYDLYNHNDHREEHFNNLMTFNKNKLCQV